MDSVRVAVVGAAGYTGEELLRLLLRHPATTLTAVTSREHAGKPVGSVFRRFAGEDLEFVAPDAVALAADSDFVFLALPHGLAAEYAVPLLEAGVRVIDLSADFRLRDAAVYAATYDGDHPAPALLDEAVYGLPERYRDEIAGARLVACPGCYPTSVILAAAPMLAHELASSSGIVVSSMSGVSGAGRKPDVPKLFAECNESLRPYNVVGHRHTPEIEQELAAAAELDDVVLTFVPHLVPVTRGIHTTIVMKALSPSVEAEAVEMALRTPYEDEPFVRVLDHGLLADTRNVTGTNVCEIGFAVNQRTQSVVISSAIDNLTKGAAGQAVQCLNIMADLDEAAGLEG
jgi:N-acetyl-gamma-glutamyl-phosphate reductase